MTKTTQTKNTKLIGAILAIVAVIAAVEIYFGFLQHKEVANNVKIDGVFLAQTQKINDFQLSATNGKTFSKANLKGRWTMMFFGFTNCGMVCPTSMSALNSMYKLLEKDLPENQLPQVVMVSVDPDRDSMQRMQDYVKSFNPHFIGARADIAETVQLEKQLHIAAAKIEADGQGKNQYTINHSAEVLLFNPAGDVQAFLSYPHKAEQMAQDYKLILKSLG